VQLKFTDPLDAKSIAPESFEVKVWGLKRSQNYGSKHLGERSLTVAGAGLSGDRQTVTLKLPDLAPTWCMEIKYRLQGDDGRLLTGRIHNSIHALGTEK
jgi:hypothetical protein